MSLDIYPVKKETNINCLMIGRKMLRVMLKNLLRNFKFILKKRKIIEWWERENKFFIMKGIIFYYDLNKFYLIVNIYIYIYLIY